MVKWGDSPVTEALLERLQSFLPVPKNGDKLSDYFGVGYPLFGDSGVRWSGLREWGMPVLITENRIITDGYVRKVCPEGKENLIAEAMFSGSWKIPEGLHIRVWTKQPVGKGSLPDHALPETIDYFASVGLSCVEFMNTVKTKDNSVAIKEMGFNVSKPFFDDWISVMRSGEPYICFSPVKSSGKNIPGLAWFCSVLGLSVGERNQKLIEEELWAKLGGGTVDADQKVSPEGVWLWKVRELARAYRSALRRGDTTSKDAMLHLQTKLQYGLNDLVKAIKKTNKEYAEEISNVGNGLLKLALEEESIAEVLKTIDTDLREDDDLSSWWEQMDAVQQQVRQNTLQVAF